MILILWKVELSLLDKNKNFLAILYAILAAGFYAISIPFSKLLLKDLAPTLMAAFLYLGAGLGVGFMYIFAYKNEDQALRLNCPILSPWLS